MILLELLRAIGKRPGLYIGDFARNRYSIWHLRAFLVGYQSGRQALAEGDEILDSLTFWVCTRYGVPDGPLDWSGHFLRQCGEDDEAAFRLFFELLEEYVRDREQLGPEGIKAGFTRMLEQHDKHES
jgi:hypothetical protein